MRFRKIRRRGVSAALVTAVLMVSAPAAGAPTIDASGAAATEMATRGPTTSGPGAAVGQSSLLISDSAWLGIYLYGGGLDAVQGFEHTFALASCRRRVVRSCTNFDGYVPITLLQRVESQPDRYGTLIVATGYNDDDRAFREQVDTIITGARSNGYQRVVWLTLRSNVSYVSPGDAGFAQVFRNNNATLRDLAASNAYPELFVADWASYARDQPGWFSSDGIHLRRRGTYAAGDYISRKMAHLDQRACPQPLAGNGPMSDPCPDPDVDGPLVNLDSLYPVNAQQPRVPFLLNFEGSSSWPAPPWWES